MAITFVSVGSIGSGSTTATPGYPTSIASGDLLILGTSNKYPTNGPSTPSGWNLIGQFAGGSGSSGVDTGSVYATAFYRIANGTESGTLSLSYPSANVSTSRISRYTKGGGETWVISGPSVGAFSTPSTSWSVTGDVSLDLTAGDFVVAISAVNSDLYSYTSESLSVSGAGFSAHNERTDHNTFGGEDCGMIMSDHTVSSAGSAAPVFTMTSSGSVTNSPAGSTVMFRIRATSSSPGSASGSVGTVTVSTAAGTAVGKGAASGTIGTVTVSTAAGTATGKGAASGGVGTVTVSVATGSAVGNGAASGTVGTVTVTPCEGSADTGGAAFGAIGTVTLTPCMGLAVAAASTSGGIGTVTLTPCAGFAIGDPSLGGVGRYSNIGIGIIVGT